MAVMDVVAKQIYSVTLLTGNFCIMDVVSTLRLNQVLRCVAVCCSVLQCVAVCCGNFCILDVVSTLLPQPGVAVRCSALQHIAAISASWKSFPLFVSTMCCSVLQCIAVCCGNFCIMDVVSTLRLNQVLHCVAVCCSVLQCVAAICASWKSCPLFAPTKSCRVLQSVAGCCKELQCV